MTCHFSYEATLESSRKASWQIEDIIGGDKVLDFTKPFMPESLARVEPLDFLAPHEKLILNQIRGHGYLYVFGLVEEFILPFVMDHARPRLRDNDFEARALLQFAAEEAKHIQLFKLFRQEFLQGFGTDCDVIGPAEAVASAVLAHDPLAVAIAILHIEWMTLSHYRQSIRDNQDLDPQFRSLLKHHWMEEAQHAKIDTLIVQSMAAGLDSAAIEDAFAGYLDIGMFLDNGLKQQTEFDLDCFERAIGRTLPENERELFRSQQHQAQRWTYLGSGMTTENFKDIVDGLAPGLGQKLAEVAPLFS